MNSWFLSTVSPWPLLLGVMLLLSGVTSLYLAWRQPERNWLLIGVGWGLLFVAHWPLGWALRFDRGWALTAIVPGFIALLWLALSTPWQQWERQGRQRQAKHTAEPVSRYAVLRNTGSLFGQIIVFGLLSFCATLGAALALFSLLDTSIVNRTVSAALLVMLLWPVLIVWSKAKASLLRPALYFIGASIAGLMFTPVLF